MNISLSVAYKTDQDQRFLSKTHMVQWQTRKSNTKFLEMLSFTQEMVLYIYIYIYFFFFQKHWFCFQKTIWHVTSRHETEIL